MKIVMIGGGAHRVLGILRGAMAIPDVLDGGKIHLYDLNPVRVEAMGRMLQKTPEFQRAGCEVRWEGSLEEALEGADVVGIILPAGSQRMFALGHAPSIRQGFISSDNLSPSGALAAVRIAPVLMNVARKMEIHCPGAWLVNFVNPIAVLSGMVNHHTRVKTLGVCAGFTNHLWDIPRLFGRDEEARSLEVETAGVNHLGYIVRGRWEGEDLFEQLRARVNAGWTPPELQPYRNERLRKIILASITRLARFWNDLGVLVFSTEGDGMDHLMYEEAVEGLRQTDWDRSEEEIDHDLKQQAQAREEADRSFEGWLSRDLDTAFWSEHGKTDPRFERQDEDIFVRIFAALAGVREAKIVTSRPNEGAVAGIKDRHVVEYTQSLFKGTIRHEGPYEIPDGVHGLTASLAAHQTLLGDALATQDPRELAHALLSYPVNPYSRPLRALYRELFAINAAGIAPALQKIVSYFK